jgi:hypothetical protein
MRDHYRMTNYMLEMTENYGDYRENVKWYHFEPLMIFLTNGLWVQTTLE